MGKKKKKWNGKERREHTGPYYMGDRRKNGDKVNADFVPTRNDERYQFEGLVIYYRARFNVWQVHDMKKPSFEQILFEVVGYANGMDALTWAKDYARELKYKEEKKESK
jgi:hypothetical protein